MGTLRTATPPPSFLYTKIGGFARYLFLPKIHLEELSKFFVKKLHTLFKNHANR